MSETRRSTIDPPEGGPYEIRLRGHLDDRWGARFDGLTLSQASDGTTILRGPIVDQAALHGLLQKLRDLGLPLVSVTQVHADEPGEPTSRSRSASPLHDTGEAR